MMKIEFWTVRRTEDLEDNYSREELDDTKFFRPVGDRLAALGTDEDEYSIAALPLEPLMRSGYRHKMEALRNPEHPAESGLFRVAEREMDAIDAAFLASVGTVLRDEPRSESTEAKMGSVLDLAEHWGSARQSHCEGKLYATITEEE